MLGSLPACAFGIRARHDFPFYWRVFEHFHYLWTGCAVFGTCVTTNLNPGRTTVANTRALPRFCVKPFDVTVF